VKVLQRVRFSSLELNWLPNSIKKGLILPQIFFVQNSGVGGGYYRVKNFDNDWGNLTKRPIIVIDIHSETNDLDSTIAHEFRHHWQLYTYGNWISPRWKIENSYKKSIIKFYSSCPYERDALQFETKLAPNDTNLEWKEWLLE